MFMGQHPTALLTLGGYKAHKEKCAGKEHPHETTAGRLHHSATLRNAEDVKIHPPTSEPA